MREKRTLWDIQAANHSRALRWHPGGLEEWSPSDWAVALGGECGELLNAVKKLNRLRDKLSHLRNQSSNEGEVIDKIAEECADVFLYLQLLAMRLGIDLEHAIVQKFNAVSEQMDFPERL